ncbi:MAG: hypothetical protein Q8Q91_00380, partial [Candidatus Daviesbacteria bacterium]|nr:hypothetical protein [Candidatus Daviesbacteria bacterium]
LAVNLKDKIIFPKIGKSQPLENELREFLNILKAGHKVKSYDLAFGVKTIKLLDQIEKAAQKNF